MEMQDFIKQTGVTAQVTRIPTRTDRVNDEWDKDAFHFLVQLKRGKDSMTINYSMGCGHAKFDKHEVRRAKQLNVYMERDFDRAHGGDKIKMAEKYEIRVIPPTPELADVLDSLASDATGYKFARDFEDWCGNYGYNTDSRTAERIYNAVAEQTKQLKKLFGGDFETLLYQVERL